MTTPPARNGNRFAFTIVTALFFLWGFISCMNDLLIPKFKADFNLNQAQANLVQFAFFGAYFLVSLAYFLISAAKGDPIKLFHEALTNVKPHLEVRSRRAGVAPELAALRGRPEYQTTVAMLGL